MPISSPFARTSWAVRRASARLLVRDLATLKPCGGGQEKGYRRGTQDVPGAAGFAAALEARPYDMTRLAALRAQLERRSRLPAGPSSPRARRASPTIGAIALPGASSMAMLVQLDLAGIAVSAGSACSSGKMKASHVLEAMGVAPDVAGGFLRFSFGPETSDADIERFLGEWRHIAEQRTCAA